MATSKAAAVEALCLAFEQDEIRIPNDAALIGELEQFEAKPLPSGFTRYAAPCGAHDDLTMALCIAWAGAARQRRRSKVPALSAVSISREYDSGGIRAVVN